MSGFWPLCEDAGSVVGKGGMSPVCGSGVYPQCEIESYLHVNKYHHHQGKTGKQVPDIVSVVEIIWEIGFYFFFSSTIDD